MSYLPAADDTPDEAAWVPENLNDLDWALSRIADAEREITETQAQADAAIARIKLRVLGLSERAAKTADFFRSKVAAYCEEHRAELLGSGKRKSRALLHGTVSWRKVSARLELQAPEAALSWAQSQPVESGLVRIKEEVALAAVHAHHKATGEIPPGFELSPETEELTIKAEVSDV